MGADDGGARGRAHDDGAAHDDGGARGCAHDDGAARGFGCPDADADADGDARLRCRMLPSPRPPRASSPAPTPRTRQCTRTCPRASTRPRGCKDCDGEISQSRGLARHTAARRLKKASCKRMVLEGAKVFVFRILNKVSIL